MALGVDSITKDELINKINNISKEELSDILNQYFIDVVVLCVKKLRSSPCEIYEQEIKRILFQALNNQNI